MGKWLCDVSEHLYLSVKVHVTFFSISCHLLGLLIRHNPTFSALGPDLPGHSLFLFSIYLFLYDYSYKVLMLNVLNAKIVVLYLVHNRRVVTKVFQDLPVLSDAHSIAIVYLQRHCWGPNAWCQSSAPWRWHTAPAWKACVGAPMDICSSGSTRAFLVSYQTYLGIYLASDPVTCILPLVRNQVNKNKINVTLKCRREKNIELCFILIVYKLM